MPALRALGRARRADPLAVAAQPRIGRLLAALGVADRAIDFDSLRLDALFRRGGREDGSTERGPREERVAPVARFTRVICWFGAGDPGFVARLTALAPGAIVAPPWVAGRPVWEHLLATVGVAPGEAARLRERIVVPAELAEAGRRALARAGWDGATRLVVVHPGAGGVAKRWPVEAFAAVLERAAAHTSVTLALHEGPADREAVAGLAARLRVPALSLVEPELPLLAGMLSTASAYLGNDSGVSHLAAALGAPSVVLYRRDKLDWRPWAPGVEPLVVETSSLERADVPRVTAALRRLVG